MTGLLIRLIAMGTTFEPYSLERSESAAQENGWSRIAVEEIKPATDIECTWGVAKRPFERTWWDRNSEWMLGLALIAGTTGVVWLLFGWVWVLAIGLFLGLVGWFADLRLR